MAKCEICGKALGGLMGASAASPSFIKECKDAGLKFNEIICNACANEQFAKISSNKQLQENEAMQKAHLMEVCTFSPYSNGTYKIISFVSAHVALGTGPISQLLSSVTDFFGAQSETYSNKMVEAENACIQKLKINACKLTLTL